VTGVVIEPPAMLGVLGGGQLGRYFALAARTMGYGVVVLEPDADAPAGVVADHHLIAEYDDPGALAELARRCAAVTVEFENPPARALDRLAADVIVAPPAAAIAVAQDRRAEKAFLVASGVAVGPHAVIESPVDVATAAAAVSFPAVLKTARFGYDGRGQRHVGRAADLAAAWDALDRVPCVVETMLELDAEISVILARTHNDVAVLPVVENHHVEGILDLSVAPARVPAVTIAEAVDAALVVADALQYVGVLAVECFVVDGEVLVNELAPRPHNSGHLTLDATRSSQFDLQVRALCGLPFGATDLIAPAAMVNLLGDLWDSGPPRFAFALDHPGATLHLYGKRVPRRGRKMGHLTVVAGDTAEAVSVALGLRERLRQGASGGE
jgi:5-(carboxyamino)imidazole ribonucleotide synthase